MKNGPLGFVQWFPFLDFDLVDSSIYVMDQLGVSNLRTCLSWADYERPGGKQWFDWVLNRLYQAGITIFPCLFYTPAHCALLPNGYQRSEALTAFPPDDPKKFHDFLLEIMKRYGHVFKWVLLWNEPNNTAYWRSDLDPEHRIFCDLMLESLKILKAAGKKSLIGSIIPPYLPWLRLMKEKGILEQADAIGIHDFPGTWNDEKRQWRGWDSAITEIREFVGPGPEIWITETGYSTKTLESPDDPKIQKLKEYEQIKYFTDLRRTIGCERIFWYSIFDQKPGHSTDNERNRPNKPPHDPRADGLGIITYDGKPKELFFHLLVQMKNLELEMES